MRSDRTRRDLCPIDVDTQQWIDARASWILHQFGWERIHNCPAIVPTTEFFPDPFRESEAGAQVMLEQLCTYLGLDSSSIQLGFFYEGERVDGGPTAAGLFQQNEGPQFRVWIEYSVLSNPVGLAATMVHELCHVHLLGHGRLTSDEDDHEPLTDLLAIFLGLGVILANSVLRDTTERMGPFETWRIRRQGYLTMPMCGYALAMFAQIRGEQSPKWTNFLRPDVRDAFQKSQSYFQHYGLPDLRSVVATTARPKLFLAETINEDSVELDESDHQPQTSACHFCGVTLPRENPNRVCEECQASIAENQQDIEVDRQHDEAESRIKRIVFRGGCFLFVAIFVICALLDWLGILE